VTDAPALDVPRSARSETRLAVWLLFVLAFVALNYAGRAEGDPPPEDLLYRWTTFVEAGLQVVFMLVFVLAICWRGPAVELLALRKPSSWRAARRITLAVVAAIVVVAVALEPVLHAGDEQGFVPERWDSSRAAPFAANFVIAALLFPIVEELIFRGAGFALFARFGRLTAVVATGVLFALAHGLINALPVLIVFGLGLGWLRERTQSVVPCIAAHALFNALALAAVVVSGQGS
jgi:membrane protease YdiL (CAAX protease family)